MPVRQMQDVDCLSRRFRDDGSRGWLGAKIKTLIYLDGWRDSACILEGT